jgi:hypothetical protein
MNSMPETKGKAVALRPPAWSYRAGRRPPQRRAAEDEEEAARGDEEAQQGGRRGRNDPSSRSARAV